MITDLQFHEIVSLNDELYDPWLDLYQTAFPLNEQMRVSDHNRVLRSKAKGKAKEEHLLAALDREGKLVAMARYDDLPECRAAALWYMAVVPGLRSKGIGSRLYQHILQQLGAAQPAAEALLLEVETPELTHTPKERELAVKRIAFYQRNGAKLLRGIDYTQSVGWQPPVRMSIMVHPLHAMAADEAFRLAECLFEDSLQQAGPLALE